MHKHSLFYIGLLWAIAALLYYPVFFSSYFFTDEVLQLWLYGKDSGFHMFADQGRFVTDALFKRLYSGIDHIDQIMWLRLFSFLGWLCCLPAWFLPLRKIAAREKLPSVLPFLVCLYIIAVPPFALSVGWTSCMEMFIANTSGFLSGYVLYASITRKGSFSNPALGALVVSVILGLLSLCTYQSGFCCFILPFLVHALAQRRITRILIVGIVAYFGLFVLYFPLFKILLTLMSLGGSARTSLSHDPLAKLRYFINKPLTGAFHFTWLVRENSLVGHIISLFLIGILLAAQFLRDRDWLSPLRRLIWPLMTCVLLLLLYFPSLITQENYASNRTLFSLELGVFLFCLEALSHACRLSGYRTILLSLVGLFLAGTAWYNIRYLFLYPLVREYTDVRTRIETSYTPGLDTVYMIRPGIDLFTQKYGITTSWDEFGLPSTYQPWVPEYFVRQVVFEKTGSRARASSLVIRSWPDKVSWEQTGILPGKQAVLIDVEKIEQAL